MLITAYTIHPNTIAFVTMTPVISTPTIFAMVDTIAPISNPKSDMGAERDEDSRKRMSDRHTGHFLFQESRHDVWKTWPHDVVQ